ncbi:MAG: putative Fe-S cluster assembly protein SufT [Candidatus Omnitrophica bacterium]|nr:putative Fe-S cluster assembly protein SufT [Candidatus Omnitrophota bacterium]
MSTEQGVRLQRDCEATQIPSGARGVIAKGTEVRITQCLGGSFTVITDDGTMHQIAGKDADALGKEIPQKAKAPDASQGSVEKLIWDQMRTCYDPEIPVNMVDLGLIYDCKIQENEKNEYRVSIKMTLTAPGCGMGQVLTSEVQRKVLSVPGVKEADVELVWDPPWDQSRLSEAAKLQLGMM